MTPTERKKAIDTMIAGVARMPMVPNELKVGLAAMAEELRVLSAAIAELECKPWPK